jgi:hypothetical protein
MSAAMCVDRAHWLTFKTVLVALDQAFQHLRLSSKKTQKLLFFIQLRTFKNFFSVSHEFQHFDCGRKLNLVIRFVGFELEYDLLLLFFILLKLKVVCFSVYFAVQTYINKFRGLVLYEFELFTE